MFNTVKRLFTLTGMCFAFTFSGIAQNTVMTTTDTLSHKGFRKWSIGLQMSGLCAAGYFQGLNDFQDPHNHHHIAYGANIKYQFTGWFAFQADIFKGKLEGSNDAKLANGDMAFPHYRSVENFLTNLHYAASISGVLTAGNINWLRTRARLIPYLSVGVGLANWHTQITTRSFDTKETNTTALFIPIGLGLKIRLANSVNLDLALKTYYVQSDALDGSSDHYTASGKVHKDQFSSGNVGIEFALGNKIKHK